MPKRSELRAIVNEAIVGLATLGYVPFGNPESRNEAILQNMLGADNPIIQPESRIEVLLLALLDKLGGSGTDAEVQLDYQILNKRYITVEHGSESRANYNSYLILTQMGIVYIKVVNGTGTAVNLAGYSYDVTCTVEDKTVDIDLGYEWNVGVIVPILNDYVESVTFA